MGRSTVFYRALFTAVKYPSRCSFSTAIIPQNSIFTLQTSRGYSTHFSNLSLNARVAAADRALQDLTHQAQHERAREREERIKAGLGTADLDAEEEEDYMGVGPLIEKLEKEKAKGVPKDLNRYEEPTDSDSDSDSDDDERFSWQNMQKQSDQFEKKSKKHEELVDAFAKAETFDDASKLMKSIDTFEETHFRLRPEYRVIGDLMNRLKVAEGKDKFLFQVKLNRALRMAECADAFDPNNPANYGVIHREDHGSFAVRSPGGWEEPKREEQHRRKDDDDGMEFDDEKEKDNVLLGKISELDKKLEQKLAELDHTFGRTGKLLEEEIRDLAEERNSLTDHKRKHLYRKGFDVKLIHNLSKKIKVRNGNKVSRHTTMVACGNYHGVVGFGKGKSENRAAALQKAYEKCFQNLHFVERHEEHTIVHAVQASFKKTKMCLWPAPTRTGINEGRIVQTILCLAGFKNVRSKVVGSRNPENTVKALFKALNAVETPKDVQEKFGRTVVESYLAEEGKW